MSDLKNQASYGVGMSIGQSLNSQNLEGINLDRFIAGIKDVFAEGELELNPEDANTTIQAYINEVNESKYAVNKAEGTAFLAVNAQKDGVVTLESGLQYEVITAAEGEAPSETAEVTVHYHGTLADGTVFDSSVSRGEPATFGVNQVIKGWTEALQLMPVGSKWRLFIPEDLAYGANPHPEGPIKPFMTLIFDVELIAIN